MAAGRSPSKEKSLRALAFEETKEAPPEAEAPPFPEVERPATAASAASRPETPHESADEAVDDAELSTDAPPQRQRTTGYRRAEDIFERMDAEAKMRVETEAARLGAASAAVDTTQHALHAEAGLHLVHGELVVLAGRPIAEAVDAVVVVLVGARLVVHLNGDAAWPVGRHVDLLNLLAAH